MKMVNGLTKANIKNYGIELAPQHDFKDDGNKFRGFIYKGMPMTQCRYDGECYLKIKVDYLKNNFTFKEWMETEEYELADEFNGVNEFDMDKLIENLERVIAKVNEMNAGAKVDSNDLEIVKDHLRAEIAKREEFLEDIKVKFEWWNVNTKKMYYAQQVIEYTNNVKREIDRGNAILSDLDTADIQTQKRYIENCRSSYGVLGNGWYMEQAYENMKKAAEA